MKHANKIILASASQPAKIVRRAGSVFLLSILALLAGCLGKPDNIEPVSDFKLDKYLGTWYEIARLNHPFEQNLINVSANYTLRDDGGVNVLNKGFNTEDNEQEDITGRAYFVGDTDKGFLKVSFFGPFFGSYIVFETDYDQYAFVTGPNKEYLWLLAREPEISDELYQRFLNVAEEKGYNTGELIRVEQGVEVPSL